MKCKNCGEALKMDYSDVESKIVLAWHNILFEGIDSLPYETKRKIVKGCSLAHYDSINMDDVLKAFVGDIYGFKRFLETEWGWIVTINEEERVITADENKAKCICPIVELNGIKSTSMCYCSEGIAEKMFSVVLQQDATATVVNSVLRGDKSCVYEIRWSEL